MNLIRLSAFADQGAGGNPAGVVIADALPEARLMQSIAARVGYSETAFAAPQDGAWRVRYFAPESEVAFCGHATLALGAALAMKQGDADFDLELNSARISVRGTIDGASMAASLWSPPTRSETASDSLIDRALALFSYHRDDLDPRIAPARTSAGVGHLVLALRSREKLAAMRYELATGRQFMVEEAIATINLIHAEHDSLFHSRNPFAFGGVYEDPATGAAAAALAGYLRDIDWPCGSVIEIIQGEDMGMRSRLDVDIPAERGASVRVHGAVRFIGEERFA